MENSLSVGSVVSVVSVGSVHGACLDAKGVVINSYVDHITGIDVIIVSPFTKKVALVIDGDRLCGEYLVKNVCATVPAQFCQFTGDSVDLQNCLTSDDIESVVHTGVRALRIEDEYKRDFIPYERDLLLRQRFVFDFMEATAELLPEVENDGDGIVSLSDILDEMLKEDDKYGLSLLTATSEAVDYVNTGHIICKEKCISILKSLNLM